jgi:DNA-binding NarL/FixJ family response regulator
VSHQQEVSLSSREQQVLRLLMAEGRSIPEISRELHSGGAPPEHHPKAA